MIAKSMDGALHRLWREGVILRTERLIYEVEKSLQGQGWHEEERQKITFTCPEEGLWRSES